METLHDFLVKENREHVLREVIKSSVPAARPDDINGPLYRNCLIKALKAIIFDGDQRYGVVPIVRLRTPGGFYVEERVREFINKNMAVIGQQAIEMQREHSRFELWKESTS